tara:strand:- start:1093 stop:1395 length:303 start_codon:yes stop_codon:yes gene_type:complete
MAYGLEVYAANGTIIIDVSSREARSVGSDRTASIANGAFVDVTVSGMTSGDNWAVYVTPVSPPNSFNSQKYTSVRNSGYFRITNNMQVASAFDYIVIRTG